MVCVGGGRWCGSAGGVIVSLLIFVLQGFLNYFQKQSVEVAILFVVDPVRWHCGGGGSHGCLLWSLCLPKFDRQPFELLIGRGADISLLWDGALCC